tara:strand:- start:1996 stop:5775 length:3780 start_codon:yes stop_codon:yes gene_type:complete
MALIDSKQLNPRLTGSFTLSGSLVGDSNATASFGVILGDGSQLSGITTTYNGNRRILNTKLPTMYTSSFVPGTTGSIGDFLDAVFYPNTAPQLSSSRFTIQEFVDSGQTVGTITTSDAEHFSYELTFATQSSYTDNFFTIHSGSGVITTNTSTSASMNTENRGDDVLAHPFNIKVTDDSGLATTASIYIRVTPNTAPKFRTTSVEGSIISAQTGSVNENTTTGTTVLTFFVTDSEDDTITVHPLSQSASPDNDFAISTTNVAGGKRITLTTATSSFNFDPGPGSKQQYKLFVSASDEHQGNTSGSYVTTLPIEVNVTDNLAPTMASQVFTVSESSGSHTDHGLGTSTNSQQNVGTITTNDNEGDTVTFSALTITSGSGGGNSSQTDPSNDPFQISTTGTLQLKAGQYLNSDLFDQYKYTATYQDNFNAASSSGTITINLSDDPIPTLTDNRAFYIIESASSGSSVRTNTNGRTGTVADFNSNETVAFTVNPSNRFSIASNGNLSVNFDVSGSAFTFDAGNTIDGSVTASNAFGTVTQSEFSVNVAINNAPQPSFSDNATFLNTNEARPGSNTLSTITFSDTESDTLNHNTFVFTDPSGQLTTVKSGDTYLVRASQNLSGSTYQMTASIQDEHGFRTGTATNEFTIAQADVGVLGGDTQAYIIESANNGASLKDNSNGRTGDNAQLSVSYANPGFGSPAVASYTSSNAQIAVDSSGNLTLGFQLSGSAFNFDNSSILTSDITFQDQYQNLGSGSVSASVAINNAPQPSFSDNSTNLNTNLARGSNLLSTISFTDTESDTLNHGSFVFTAVPAQLTAVKSGDDYLVRPTQNLSAGLYRMTASIQDEHGFRTGTQTNEFTIAQAPAGVMSTNGTFYIIESAVSGALIRTNSNGRTGTQGDLGVTYSPNYGSAAVANFTSSNAMINIEDNGNLSFKQNVSASAFTFDAGNPITSNITFQDQYQNLGSGSISVNVAINNAPTVTITPSSQTLDTEHTLSGSLIATATFSDTESDTINLNTFSFSGTHGNLFSASIDGSNILITANQDISASLSQYSFSGNVKDVHGFRTGTASATLNVRPMVYLYKQTQGVQTMSSANAIAVLGDPGGDDVDVTTNSVIDNFKSGSIGSGSFATAGGQTTLITSQSSYNLAGDTFRNFGNVDLSGNSGNGHSWLVVFPSSSAMGSKPNTMAGSLGGSTLHEYVIFNDNSIADAVESSGIHYFSTNEPKRGVSRFGMIHGVGANTETTQFYHLVPSSGSTPSSEN